MDDKHSKHHSKKHTKNNILMAEEVDENNIPDNETDKEDENIINDALSTEFQDKVKAYLKFDNILREKKRESIEIQKNKKECENFIIKYLDKIDESVVLVDNERLKKSKTNIKMPLTKQIIIQALQENIVDTQLIETLLNTMEIKRPIKEKISIRRSINKKSISDAINSVGKK